MSFLLLSKVSVVYLLLFRLTLVRHFSLKLQKLQMFNNLLYVTAIVRRVFTGGSLRFSTEGQLSLTPGQRIGKGQRALTPRGVQGQAPPVEILWSQGRVFLHFEAADNDFQQPKKDNFSRQFNHD